MRRTIRLTESELRRMIAESIKRIMKEGTIDDIKDIPKRSRYPFIDDDYDDDDDEIRMGVL
jgi:hypothetical protein